VNEAFEDISSHINFLKSLFNKYLIIYKPTECRNFIKVSICGVGKRQLMVQKSIAKLINSKVKKDCLIKISMYSNLFDCMEESMKKILETDKQVSEYHHFSKEHVFHSNIEEEMMNKILRRINKK
jgi:hypothetical protein